MKQFKIILFVLLTVIATSCKDTDTPEIISNKIIGTYHVDRSDISEFVKDITIVIKSDNTYSYNQYIVADGDSISVKLNGHWRLNEACTDIIFVVSDDEISEEIVGEVNLEKKTFVINNKTFR